MDAPRGRALRPIEIRHDPRSFSEHTSVAALPLLRKIAPSKPSHIKEFRSEHPSPTRQFNYMNRPVFVGQVVNLMPHSFPLGRHSAQIVGQPILAAAGFLAGFRLAGTLSAPRKSRLERRLRAKLPGNFARSTAYAGVRGLENYAALGWQPADRLPTGPAGRQPGRVADEFLRLTIKVALPGALFHPSRLRPHGPVKLSHKPKKF
jgi:hypothetical protein